MCVYMSARAASAITALAGHRAVLIPAASDFTPLVLIGGTGQWVDSWTTHVSGFRDRPLLLYETAGQGKVAHDLSDMTLTRHTRDLQAVLAAAGWADRPVDLAGFSFGGRLAMAAAASGGLQVRRVVSTAVASRRTARGRFALRGCLASLRSGDMQGFGYQITLASYSSSFLAEHEARVPKWVDALARECTSEGVGAIIAETLATEEEEHPLHTERLASRIASAGAVEGGLIISGTEDAFSTLSSGADLARVAGWEHLPIEGAAHAVPLEKPRAWRDAVKGFLAKP